MKTFTTSGTGSQQTLSPIETDKIPVYDSVTDAEADLANLAENQIIATHDTGSELSAPVDVVQSGNMHAVTSNAVATAMLKAKYVEGSATFTANTAGSLSIPFDNSDMSQIVGYSITRQWGNTTGAYLATFGIINPPDSYRKNGILNITGLVSVTQVYTLGVTIYYR